MDGPLGNLRSLPIRERWKRGGGNDGSSFPRLLPLPLPCPVPLWPVRRFLLPPRVCVNDSGRGGGGGGAASKSEVAARRRSRPDQTLGARTAPVDDRLPVGGRGGVGKGAFRAPAGPAGVRLGRPGGNAGPPTRLRLILREKLRLAAARA